jgi:hypothetical protein
MEVMDEMNNNLEPEVIPDFHEEGIKSLFSF